MIVYSVFWGDKYSPDYVPRLRDQVHKHLSIPHEFRCITDHQFWDVDCIEPICDYPGWWAKLSLFKPNALPFVPSLYLDLDVAIVGSLDPLAYWIEDTLNNHGLRNLLCPANWAQSGHGGCQSSLMAWVPGFGLETIWNEFAPEWAVWPSEPPYKKYHGDQCHITALRDAGKISWLPTPPEWTVSYKYHCKEGLPPKAKVVTFHGSPKPHEVEGYF